MNTRVSTRKDVPVPRTLRGRVRQWLLLIVGALIVVMIAVILAVMLVQSGNPEKMMRSIHAWLTMARPWVIGMQIAGLATIWWYWPAIVRRARFAPAVTEVWLALRPRVLIWGLAFLALNILLWTP